MVIICKPDKLGRKIYYKDGKRIAKSKIPKNTKLPTCSSPPPKLISKPIVKKGSPMSMCDCKYIKKIEKRIKNDPDEMPINDELKLEHVLRYMAKSMVVVGDKSKVPEDQRNYRAWDEMCLVKTKTLEKPTFYEVTKWLGSLFEMASYKENSHLTLVIKPKKDVSLFCRVLWHFIPMKLSATKTTVEIPFSEIYEIME